MEDCRRLAEDPLRLTRVDAMLESNFLTLYVLPIYLMLIMAGMGMTLTPADFKRVFEYPMAATVGLIGQLMLVPIAAFLCAKFLITDPQLAVGFIILGACPGGITSNLCVYLARGDTALSITLTAVSSVLTMFTIPLIVGTGLLHFLGVNSEIQLPIGKTMLQVFAITVLPISIGMFVRAKAPGFARDVQGVLEIMLIAFLILLVTVIVFMEWSLISTSIAEIGLVTLLLSFGTLGVGFLVSWMTGLPPDQRIAVGIELGIQNGTLGVVIAMSVLGNLQLAIPSGLYALVMLFAAGIIIAVIPKPPRVTLAGPTATPPPTGYESTNKPKDEDDWLS